MIAKLTGLVDTVTENTLILDVNGVGYLLHCGRQTLSNLPEKGSETTVCVETLMRAEQLILYGFGSIQEKESFITLMTVQGVGGRMALAILSALTPDRLYQAISAQEPALLTQADGVGPKLANRIVRELKEKVGRFLNTDTVITPIGNTVSPSATTNNSEALSALLNLGYRRTEAMEAVSKAQLEAGENADLNAILPLALKKLAQGASR
jgi:Holliday junction DNA helicase RuvA